ncbi:ead/Ea22-like family protein [Pseudomonas aeruginosa]|uniref:ead/Ea22-like family protein n=1 Tax=Pseudomonas aeruginosa TaxID=287 RepID=UPI0025CA03FD|nr:ead/Ea22-like family protein [Pseudomonas aeruginosa]EKH5750240.1 ead/Ea22-like family protein [Pseudomonas aeruginosa]EKW9803271.1 ead/Ea22-like family protein [Pseudomonas aeruginosa]ELN4321925.1 ead/Ea22-like family protein [Pseudomonas aeruginosa]ELN4394735.1 ead/Ea22-like family protein [Pseudomonas aeruginosa]
MTDHAELRRLAEAATPGPWSCNRHWAIVGGPILEFTNGAAQQQIAMACGQSWMRDDELRNNAEFIAANNPKTVLALLDEIDGLSDELSACTEHPGGCGYWREAAKRRAEERDRLRAQNDALRGALHAVQAEVDGNLRPLTRDLVNMVSGLNNGTHPNDIYDHCDEIERIIDAALEGATQ